MSLPKDAEMSTRATHTYTLCGWRTLSDIPLTSIPSSVRGDTIDVRIRIADGVSRCGPYADLVVFEHSRHCSVVGIRDVADFEVREGREILVWPAHGAAQKDIEIVLFGLAWGTMCHQRGILPLHASAVMSPAGITAFAGHRGAGKSTTAALVGSLGFNLIADDILPVSFDQDAVPGAWPYLRRHKLRSNSVADLALTPTETVGETLDQGRCFVRPERFAEDRWSRIDQIIALDIDPNISNARIDLIKGAEAVRTLIDHTYHFAYVLRSEGFREHLALCAQLASKVPVYRLRRPPSSGIQSEVKALIYAQL